MNNSCSPVSLSIADRTRSWLGLKLALTLFLNAWVMLPYYSLQHHQLFPITVMPATFIDRLIPFSPQAVLPYLSIYLFMPIAPFLMNQRQQLLRYAIGVMMIGFVASSIFLLWPTSCERP